jgi:phosphoribosylaminoimidazolecarboxamide formyltransferase/IMP cyclohydrolase
MSINTVTQIDPLVEIRNVLISVSDKSNLDQLVTQLIEINPQMVLYSTGGTYNAIRGFLGNRAGSCLKQVSDYTGQPETQGGLVKTLDFKIYLSILTETHNADHQGDLARTNAVPFDMVVVNLYPFKQTVSKPDVTVEQARGNIDIGGPCMIRASAKNFIRVASVVDPNDYAAVTSEMRAGNGRISLDLRFRLAQKAFKHTAAYDRMITEYLNSRTMSDVNGCYSL